MKGFIVYATYDVIDEKTIVYLYGRLENDGSFVTVNSLEPYFYLEQEEAKQNKHYLSKCNVEETKRVTFGNKSVVKITHPSYTELTKIASVLHQKKLTTYEADIKPHMRFLMDKDLKGSISIQGEYTSSERVNRVYQDPIIKKSEFTPELRVLSLDIESNKDSDELYCVGLYGKNYKQVFMVSSKKLPNIISYKTEAECLDEVKRAIIKYDPDILTGWNTPDFDFPYLKRRYEKNNIGFDIGRNNSEVRLRISADFFRKSIVAIPGRQVLDGLTMIKDPFIKEAPSIKNIDIDSWTLEDVAQAILGEGKLLKGLNRHETIDAWYKEGNHQKLAEYNLQDAKLAYELLQKSNTLELAIERSQLTGITFDKLTASVAAFDSLYIREANKRGFVSPTTRYSNKEERIKGGYVQESRPGIYHNLLVLDFKSLYPSIIRTLNIDPASFITEKTSKNVITAANGAQFLNQEGILPQIIEHLHQARERAKKEKREFASYAIKIIMNSFFGVLASPNCRYFSLDMANAITHTAQAIIKHTAEKIKEKGYDVIYSDTDSVFIDTKLENKQKAEKVGSELKEYINDFYNQYIKEEYKRTSFLEIEFKRHYLSFMIPPIRAKEKGSKKRYAGLLEEKGKEKLEIVGLEAIRGDWTDAAQEFQRELLLHIFQKKEFIKFIKQFVSDLKAGKMDRKLIYRKSIRKSLEEYTKTTPPHVKAARQLDSLDSNTIEYYMTTIGPEPIQKSKHAIDYEHYIEKQLKPIANALLFFFHRTFDDILKESTQTKLFS